MPEPKWLKSSFSEASGNNCVEISVPEPDRVALRDSTRPGVITTTDLAAFRTLISALRAEQRTPLGPPGRSDPAPRPLVRSATTRRVA
ncbi:DUF397 domain-containing protein [Streptomyces sp. NPDC096310]|uniref:DUF397 domain-containing protein n=1 Tax=Streptomyces sp. NPDC096310 TaxID=3366082 RepID=UPI0037FCAB9C